MFREDIYMRTLKYRRWNNELRPFHSLKRRVANMFQRRGSTSDDSRGTSTQIIVNQMEREEETESCNSDGNSMNSNWSELLPTSRKVEYKQCSNNVKLSTSTVGTTTMQACVPPVKRTMKI